MADANAHPDAEHPYDRLKPALARYLGMDVDPVLMTLFASIASGVMAAPVHVDVVSNSRAADLFGVNRLLDLLDRRFACVETHKQLRDLERRHFPGVSAILIRGTHRTLFPDAVEYLARVRPDDYRLPSVIRVHDRNTDSNVAPGVLRVNAAAAVGRDLSRFGATYVIHRRSSELASLRSLLLRLPAQPTYGCDFRSKYEGYVRSDLSLVLERMLLVAAAIRNTTAGPDNRDDAINIGDYWCVRRLLTTLPLSPTLTAVSPRAIETADSVCAALRDPQHQRSLPDRSFQGNKWFTRRDAAGWTGWSYSATRDHLDELLAEGILDANRGTSDRRRGAEIHYRFADGTVLTSDRPIGFATANPFALLPKLDEQEEDVSK
jgi:hypothetical protein